MALPFPYAMQNSEVAAPLFALAQTENGKQAALRVAQACIVTARPSFLNLRWIKERPCDRA
jgi:hypothetical protein